MHTSQVRPAGSSKQEEDHRSGSRPDADSTGKNRKHDFAARRGLVVAAFVIGICVGVMLSERAYLMVHAPERPHANTRRLEASHSEIKHTIPHARHTESASRYPELHAKLLEVAPQKEVLVAVSNSKLLHEGMLDTFLSGLQRAGVRNYLVVALDEELYDALDARGINVHLRAMSTSAAQAGTGDNHAVSSLKFGILREFLELGWATLLSDVDVAVLRDPFPALHRDRDVEGLSDGFDERTCYGFVDGHDDPSMGWARYAQAIKHFNLNSGTFYLAANPRTISLMSRLETRLSREKYWDQTAFNEEIFFLTHGSYVSPNVSVRVMDMLTFVNSKVMFKTMRHMQPPPPMPVLVHLNYHPDKHDRMKAVMRYYFDHDTHALDRFPGGSEPGS